MARCGCAGTTCSCIIIGSGAISVDGAGSINNPYVVSGGAEMQVLDTATVNLTLTGSGAETEPFVLQADAIVSLNELTDVDTAGATTGQVLTRQADGTYKLAPPVTATAGTINVNANSVSGDGSSGSPLAVKLVAGGGITSSSAGLAVQGVGDWVAWTPVLTASTTNPSIGNGSVLGWYTQIGKLVFFRLRINWGSTSARGVGTYSISLPVDPASGTAQMFPLHVQANGTGAFSGNGRTDNAQPKIDVLVLNTASRAENMTHSVPAVMSSGSTIQISGCYEAE